MRKTGNLLLASVLIACGQPGGTSVNRAEAQSISTVDELVADPVRLKKVDDTCRSKSPRVADVLCLRVGAASTQILLREGKMPPPKGPPTL